MILIPAVDISEGCCVRLVHGDPAQKTIYSKDPVVMARQWARQGAKRLHVVDLDAAFGTGSNLDLVYRIKQETSCEVELGGGLRSLEAVRTVLRKGIDRAIIGTALLEQPDWVKEALAEFGGRLMAGVDARAGEVRLKGWKAGSGVTVEAAIKTAGEMGFREVIFTEIGRDGTLAGPAVEETRAVLRLTTMAVYASGGVSTLDDLKTLKTLEPEGLAGCIVGKALYDSHFFLTEAFALC